MFHRPPFYVLAAILSFFLGRSNGAKILALPLAIKSHVTEMDAIGRELEKRGHEVVFLLPRAFADGHLAAGTRIVTYDHENQMVDKMRAFFDRSGEESGALARMGGLREIVCGQIVKEVYYLANLREEKFHFAIVDYVFFLKCLYLVPYNLSLPFASTGSHISRLDIGHPLAASFVPCTLSGYDLEMSFHQRLYTLLNCFFSRLLVSRFVSRVDISKIAPQLSWEEAEDLPKHSEIFLESTDSVLDFPEPVMPNFIRFGCLSVQRPEQLPGGVKAFFDSAKDGIIVASLGSQIKSSSLLHSLFLNVFRDTKQRVFWKCNGERRFENILMHPGISENDALAHPNTRLLIYHCGRNGLFESVHHGVPVLCVPYSHEERENARKVVHFGIGTFLQLSQLEELEIRKAITGILQDSRFLESVRNLSRIFKNRRQTPAEMAAIAVEHVIEFGGNYHRSRSVHQSPFQLLLGDVWLVVFLVILLPSLCTLVSGIKFLSLINRAKSKIKTN